MLNSQTIGITLCLIAVLATATAVTASAEKATPRSSEVVLQYQEHQSRVMPQSATLHGKYLGSGTGTVSGEIDGAVVWDLYEDQTDTQLHRTQFVGRITAEDGGSIDFETTGYFVPRAGEPTFWNLTSAIYLFSARGPAYQSLQGALGVWEGVVDTRTFSHCYQLRLLRSVSSQSERR